MRMTGQELLEKLLQGYRSSFDIERPYPINEDSYEAYARFDVTSAKYVLTERAELWRTKCFEHAFFKCCKGPLDVEVLENFRRQIETYIEPHLVRKGERYPEKDHMYTYITGIFICDEGVTEEGKQAARRFKYFKNYLLSLRGYAEARILVFDMKGRKIFGNGAAKPLVKGYKKVL